jgi:hypothetical protein
MILAAALMIAASPADGWTTYSNARFAFSLCYPSSVFRAGRPPDNGDGLSFAARDGATLATWGSNDALDHGLTGEQSFAERDRKGITYRAKGGNWFALSGKTGARVFYRKTFFDDRRFVSFELSYPASVASRYAPIVTRMQKCFRYGKPSF